MSAGAPNPERLLPRFLKAGAGQFSRPVLHVVVDTEEEFDWSAPFSRSNVSINFIAGLDTGQSLFRRFGLSPTYMVDYPVGADRRIADIMGPWLADGSCQVGAQLHPWVTPPFEEVVCPFNSYPCNLPEELERQKLAALVEAIATTLGERPRIYKAGRYGMDVRREAMLRGLGFEIDSSVLPHRSYAGLGGGPDFFGYPDQPFWLHEDRRFLYLPSTQSLIGPLRGIARLGLDRLVFHGIGARLRLPGMLGRLHLLERISLTPEGVSLAEMCRLVSTMTELGARVFCLTLHSPSFMVGGTPYSRTAGERDALLLRTEKFLEFFFGQLGGEATTARAIGERLAAG